MGGRYPIMQADGKVVARGQHRSNTKHFGPCRVLIRSRARPTLISAVKRGVMPQHIMVLRQARKIFFGMGKLVGIGAVKTDGDVDSDKALCQFSDDIFQSRPLQFRIQAGQKLPMGRNWRS